MESWSESLVLASIWQDAFLQNGTRFPPPGYTVPLGCRWHHGHAPADVLNHWTIHVGSMIHLELGELRSKNVGEKCRNFDEFLCLLLVDDEKIIYNDLPYFPFYLVLCCLGVRLTFWLRIHTWHLLQILQLSPSVEQGERSGNRTTLEHAWSMSNQSLVHLKSVFAGPQTIFVDVRCPKLWSTESRSQDGSCQNTAPTRAKTQPDHGATIGVGVHASLFLRKKARTSWPSLWRTLWRFWIWKSVQPTALHHLSKNIICLKKNSEFSF